MQVCRQWAGGAADGLRGHRCGAGAGAGLLLAGGAGGRGDLLRWWCAGVVIVRAARSSGRAAWSSSGPRGHRPGRAVIVRAARSSSGLRGHRAGQECGRRQGWKMGKRKRPGRRRVVRCCSGLLSALAVRSAAPGASRCISWAVGVCSPFRCRATGAGTDPGATVPAGSVPAWHGLRWRCSIRCVFAVCRRGQILHFTG